MSIHFSKRGHGPAVILLHGLFGSLENLGGIARLLSAHCTVYSLDLPEHGRSAHNETVSLSTMAQDIKDWMHSHSLKHAMFVGHSLGGKVAMEIALENPQLVEKLCVMDISPVKYEAHHNQIFNALLSVPVDTLASRGDADEVLKPSVPELPVRSFLLKNLSKVPEGRFSWRMNLEVIHRHYSELIRENIHQSYNKPTLFLKGGASVYIKESHRDEILRRFPHAQLKIVSNTGHWMHAEKPEIVSKLISKFLLAQH